MPLPTQTILQSYDSVFSDCTWEGLKANFYYEEWHPQKSIEYHPKKVPYFKNVLLLLAQWWIPFFLSFSNLYLLAFVPKCLCFYDSPLMPLLSFSASMPLGLCLICTLSNSERKMRICLAISVKDFGLCMTELDACISKNIQITIFFLAWTAVADNRNAPFHQRTDVGADQKESNQYR